MILDLIYEKKNIITFSDFSKDLDWKEYQSYSVWKKGKPFYWKTESKGNTEWLKINAIDPVKLIKIDMDFSRTFEKIRVLYSFDNVNWYLIWEGDYIPEEHENYKDVEFIFLKFEFVNVQNFIEVNKLHIYVEDKIEYNNDWLSHNIDILLPHMIKLKKPRMNKMLEGFLKMLERNTLSKKPCQVKDVSFNFGCFDVKVPPKIQAIQWDKDEIYAGGTYILEIFVKEKCDIAVLFSYNKILVEKIDWNKFRVSFPDEPGYYEMKIIVEKDSLFTTYKTKVKVK